MILKYGSLALILSRFKWLADMLNVAGQIQLNLRPEYITSQSMLTKRPTPFSLVGNDAGALGVGGSFLSQGLQNNTNALVEGGAQVNTGLAGKLSVKAEEIVSSLEMAEAGGDSGKIGISGSFSYVGHVSETVAQIDSGALIDGGAISVNAHSDVDHSNLVGGVQKAKALGIGISIGAILLERETAAVVGTRVTSGGDVPGNAGTSISATSLVVSALNEGTILSAGLAGAVIFENDYQGPPRDE